MPGLRFLMMDILLNASKNVEAENFSFSGHQSLWLTNNFHKK